MCKDIKDAKIAILTCPFEPPKLKTKHSLEIKCADDYRKLHALEQSFFQQQIKRLKDAGANIVLCQWGFDDEANHLLMQNNLPAVRWVGGVEIELLAIATGGRIIPRFEEISAEKLGTCGRIREQGFGTTQERMTVVEEVSNSKAVTVLVKGGNEMIVKEAQRCLHDAMCVVRNMIKNPSIIPGGGASELSASIAVSDFADDLDSIEQYPVRGFADALEEIPMCLAHNSGYNSIEYLSLMKEKHVKENYPYYGVDAAIQGTMDMLKQNVYETESSKKEQFMLATQVVKMILKIDDVIAPNDYA